MNKTALSFLLASAAAVSRADITSLTDWTYASVNQWNAFFGTRHHVEQALVDSPMTFDDTYSDVTYDGSMFTSLSYSTTATIGTPNFALFQGHAMARGESHQGIYGAACAIYANESVDFVVDAPTLVTVSETNSQASFSGTYEDDSLLYLDGYLQNGTTDGSYSFTVDAGHHFVAYQLGVGIYSDAVDVNTARDSYADLSADFSIAIGAQPTPEPISTAALAIGFAGLIGGRGKRYMGADNTTNRAKRV